MRAGAGFVEEPGFPPCHCPREPLIKFIAHLLQGWSVKPPSAQAAWLCHHRAEPLLLSSASREDGCRGLACQALSNSQSLAEVRKITATADSDMYASLNCWRRLLLGMYPNCMAFLQPFVRGTKKCNLKSCQNLRFQKHLTVCESWVAK